MKEIYDRQRVSNRAELVTLLFRLIDDNDATKWKNDTVYSYLQAMAAWLEDADGFYQNMGENQDADVATWQLLADALQAAAVYE